MPPRRFKRLAPTAVLLGLAFAVAGCVSDEPVSAALQPVASLPEQAPAPQPRYASYACENGTTLTVENFQTSALFVAGKSSAELPALPGRFGERFRATPWSLVLDGASATLSRDNGLTLVCRR